MSQEITVHGTVAEGFEAVREEFAAFVAGERPDYEGQLCAYVHGRRVVDLWAGGEADSLYGVFSSTKGAAHLVAALLVQDGTLELDRKVTYYWPEFAAEGKAAVTLRELLAHRAGLVGIDAGFSVEETADDRAMAERLADQKPFWRPGTAFGYHALVIGALTGEVVRRATGRTLQEVYEERVRAPTARTSTWACPSPRNPATAPRSRCSRRRSSRRSWRPGRPGRTPWPRSRSTSMCRIRGRWRTTSTPASYGPRDRRRRAGSPPRAGSRRCTRRRSASWRTARRC
ncbi:serine hydrolase domain-containing protein [Streptomyces lasalocidi]